MGGDIEIRSEEGVGTTVSIEIPILPMAAPGSGNTVTDLLIAIASSNSDPADLKIWLLDHQIDAVILDWSGTNFVVDLDTRQPDFVFSNETDSGEIERIAASVTAAFENALAVLVGSLVPDHVALPGGFVTRVETGNDTHLDNLYSLVDRSPAFQAGPAVPGYTILVVDDNETNLQLAEIALQNFGHSVRTANGGHEALRALRQEVFDLVFMDMHMPEFSGVEVSRAFAKGAAAPVPIVMLTADVTKSASADADIPEIVGFLTKPIKPSELQLAVERYVDHDRDPAHSDESVHRHQLMYTMESGSFSQENYIELHDSGVDQASLDSLVGKFDD